MRAISGQVEDNYDIIKKTSEEAAEKAVKNILEEIMSIKEIFE